jgi:hypothetical protein
MSLSSHPNNLFAWIIAILLIATSLQFAAAQERAKNFVVLDAPRLTPPISFEDG